MVRLGCLAAAVKRKLIVDPFLGISLALEIGCYPLVLPKNFPVTGVGILS
jgi:hypothetical protein